MTITSPTGGATTVVHGLATVSQKIKVAILASPRLLNILTKLRFIKPR